MTQEMGIHVKLRAKENGAGIFQGKRIIRDRDISMEDYARFKLCEPAKGGKSVKFVLACGKSYTVGLPYLLKWFADSDRVLQMPRARSVLPSGRKTCRGIRATKCRRILRRTAVRIYLSDGRTFVAPWDTVLMACERDYENYGGLTRESKDLTNRMADRYVCIGRVRKPASAGKTA